MKENKNHENYGVYITHNTYTMKWHAFKRENANRNWNNESNFKEGVGNTQQEALRNFKK